MPLANTLSPDPRTSNTLGLLHRLKPAAQESLQSAAGHVQGLDGVGHAHGLQVDFRQGDVREVETLKARQRPVLTNCFALVS